ncbi:unnamed protein product [Bursaphelenchus xylophilus]|uniref:(pine wood nematode) hypothetical protein n=1 Tax=Bursaphelenchus xylophilus TaxID=6326 RepID=A0A1I7S5Y3_BURXY|nr:unnamed protein product [Bursaphelenchus xylophilus]CAG9082520.1 unnamed protein product [Bursaphelenchus xylophilus]
MFRTAAVFTVLFVFVAARLHGLEKEVAIQDLQLLNQFQGFAQTYNKKYDSLEEARERFQIYKANQLQVQYFQQLEQGTAEFGENKFMDMTDEQFEQNVLSTIIKDPLAVSKKLALADIETSEELPQSHDWRDHGLVNRVKDQEQCGSCWAFSVVGNIEGQWKRKTGELISLSEQELVDCDFKDLACKGGEMNWAYGEIIRIGGLVKEEDYEYVGQKCFCRVDEHPIVTYINDSLQLPANEEAIRQYLFKNGPISIGLNAKTLKHYKHGIHHPFQFLCKPEDTNHAVLLVGYGEESGKPYWLLKNSWGESWGEKGYFRVFRGKNVCGVAEYATSAIIY